MVFNHFPKSKISIVAPNGQLRAETEAIMTGTVIIIPDSKIAIEVGDEIRRLLPNGREEVFVVDEPTFYQKGIGGIGAHYQVKFSRKTSNATRTDKNYHMQISGPNARVNISSQDSSTNVVLGDGVVFGQLENTLRENCIDDLERSELLELLQQLKVAQADKGAFGKAYQRFIAAAANHMTVIGPFLPALTAFLTH